MPALSPARSAWPTIKGLKLIHRGKVRDTYDLGNNLLFVVCTDAISIFDFVLNALVPDKGKVLTAMTHFWFTELESLGIKTHFVAAGCRMDAYLPVGLRDDPELQSRGMVVRKLTMHPIEFIGRVCITGSVLSEYKQFCTAGGMLLPKGLKDGDRLPYILDTPTNKAEVGHDLPVDTETVRREYAQETMLLYRVIQIFNSIAMRRGNILADTKLEMGLDEHGQLRIGDEAGTPDSSRYWDGDEWASTRSNPDRKAPTPKDKQLVRRWGITQGLNDSSKYDPLKPEDVARVHLLDVPAELLTLTTDVYKRIFQEITDRPLEMYLEEVLGV